MGVPTGKELWIFFFLRFLMYQNFLWIAWCFWWVYEEWMASRFWSGVRRKDFCSRVWRSVRAKKWPSDERNYFHYPHWSRCQCNNMKHLADASEFGRKMNGMEIKKREKPNSLFTPAGRAKFEQKLGFSTRKPLVFCWHLPNPIWYLECQKYPPFVAFSFTFESAKPP